MAWGLPKLPGMTFSDPTKTRFHLQSSLKYCQGYRCADTRVRGTGGAPVDSDSNAYTAVEDSISYDPSLTYGRVRQPAAPAHVPHWVRYDKRCLRFKAFMKQSVFENPDESYLVRYFDIFYFLEDDTMLVIEPRVKNSGIWQGRFLKRGKIPKNDLGEHWHWKDLNVGMDICIYGAVFHIVSCDLFTKEWMASQGIEIAKDEETPVDPHAEHEAWRRIKPPPRGERKAKNLRQLLEYEGKNLGFHCIWDDRESEHGEVRECKLIYFLEDDTIAIKELYDDRGGRDPFPLLLKRSKLPKRWKETPVSEYYSPCDLIVGSTLYVYGRRFLICDCDRYTRNYYKHMLNIEQPAAIEFRQKPPEQQPKPLPPHIYIGSPEDTLQSCFGMVPKPPHRDLIKAAVNMNKNLRYLCEMEWVHPEDRGRRFVMMYSLADDTIRMTEIRRKNSGIIEGKFLRAMRVQTPDSDPNFPTYYNPNMFYIGAVIPILKHRFRIIGCDLYVYRYMMANRERFSSDVIDSVRNYHLLQGNLKRDLEEAILEEQSERERGAIAQRDKPAEAQPSNLQECLSSLGAGGGPAAPPTPPLTTDRISYDDSLRVVRHSLPICESVQPLKGILKTGTAKDDQQKVVCFTGPAVAPQTYYCGVDKLDSANRMAPPREPPEHLPTLEEDYCNERGDPETTSRDDASCELPPTPGAPGAVEEAHPASGYLATRGINCSKIPEHLRLEHNERDYSKAMIPYDPEVSSVAARVGEHPPSASVYPETGM